MYQAKVLKVMIASPSDVEDERAAVREVIHEWNVIHSEDRKRVLLPVGWETHARPAVGERPQEVLNKQILRGCDLLVAVFWTRLGSPTGIEQSGTVEEINEHLAAGKPAMIYFSSAPVRPDSVNNDQWTALQSFKKTLQGRGLYDEYDSLADFRSRFSRHLAQHVIGSIGPWDLSATDGGAFAADEFTRALLEMSIHPPKPQLSEDAIDLLSNATADRNGMITWIKEHIVGPTECSLVIPKVRVPMHFGEE